MSPLHKAQAVAIALISLIASASHSVAGSQITGRCTLQFGGESYMEGPCEITPLANGGFSMRSKNGYSAMVKRSGKHQADGTEVGTATWSEVKGGKPTRSSLGKVWSHDGCWTNEVAVLCAEQNE